MFEDDVIPSEHYNLQSIKECINFMNENKNWEIFYLGRGMPLNDMPIKEINKNIYIGSFTDNHALVFNRKGMAKFLKKSNKILKKYNNKESIKNFVNSDVVISMLFKETSFCHKNTLFDQNEDFGTDNEYFSNTLTDLFRKNFGRYPISKYFNSLFNIKNIILFNENKIKINLLIIVVVLISILLYKYCFNN